MINKIIYYAFRNITSILYKLKNYNNNSISKCVSVKNNKKTLLIIDNHLPTYDKDAGGKAVFQYIKLFCSYDFDIKFIGDDFRRVEPYASELEQLGVDLLIGKYYEKNIKKWIRKNGDCINYVFTNRPRISIKYIDILKKWTNAKIIYFGHDLHFLRIERQYNIDRKLSSLIQCNIWKVVELELIKKVDVAYYPSYVEVDKLKGIDSKINVKDIPLNIYDNIKKNGYTYEKRNGVLFVGGYKHKPNVDAVLWFKNDIMPHLKILIPDIKIYICGSNAPSEIQNISDDNFIYKGFVSEDELIKLYQNCKLSVVPLRYGAGIKGKVIESMMMSLPVITTSIGAEGIKNAESIMVVEDDALKFAKKLANLYNDKMKLNELSKLSFDYVKNNYTSKKMIEIINDDFNIN